MRFHTNCIRLAAGAALLALPTAGHAAVALTGTSYAENFDRLTSSTTAVATTGGALPNGWQFAELDGNANTSYRGGNGSDNAGDTYSFGATGSSDRALGSLASGTLRSRFGVIFTNATDSAITSLDVNFVNEQWRNGSTNTPSRYAFSYRVGATDLSAGSWTTVNDLDLIDQVAAPSAGGASVDGNAVRANRSGTISGLNLAQGQSIGFRWIDVDESGADDALAIDDFVMTAGTASVAAVPEPSTWAMMFLGLALVGATARRRARRQVVA